MIKLICVGKVKEKFITDAINEYTKRLSKYTKLQIIELEDISIGNENQILEKEAQNILNRIKDNEYVIVLDINGQAYDSLEFAKMLNNQLINNSNITFVIGGSYGLHSSILNISSMRLSFSKLTFPHQLFRLIFVEQLYRAFKIMGNETYHK